VQDAAKTTEPEHRLLLRAPEAARTLGISVRMLWTLVKERRVPFVRLRAAVRFPAEALRKWIAEQTQSPEGTSPETTDEHQG